MEIKGIQKERKLWVKLLAAGLAIFMTALEVARQHWFSIPVGVLILLACFFRKEHVVSEEGVDIRQFLFGIPSHNLWKWEEITTLTTDARKERPNIVLYIGKDIVIRSFLVTPQDCQKILRLAKEKNPAITVQDAAAKK